MADPTNQPPPDKKERFNPFVNEGDMFKVLLWVAGGALVVIGLVFLVRGVL